VALALKRSGLCFGLKEHCHGLRFDLEGHFLALVKVKVVNLYSASRVHASNALGLVTN